MSLSYPWYRILSRWSVSRDCYQLYINEKIRLKQFLRSNSQRVSFTTDTWTSLQKMNYMCITTHFVDNDWKLNKKILNFFSISSDRGDIIGQEIQRCLRDWGIDKICTVTVDNASSNDVAISYLKKKFNQVGTTILPGKYCYTQGWI